MLEVFSVLNIFDSATKIKNEICQKLSKNVTDFSSISSKNLSNCSVMKKENLAESLLNLIKTCDVIPRSSVELSRGPDSVPNEIYENL